MITNTKSSDANVQQIKDQETELKELLNRVMSDPFQVLKMQITELKNRLESVENISKETARVAFPAVQSAIRTQGEDTQKNFRVLRKGINDDFSELLTASLALASEKAVAKIDESREHICKNLDSIQNDGRSGMQKLDNGITAIAGNLSSLPQGMGQLLDDQILVKNLLGNVRQEQILQIKQANDTFRQSETLLLKSFDQMNEINNLAEIAVQTSEKAVRKISESREDIRKNLDSIQADGRLEMQQLGNGITTLAESLSRTGAQLTELTPMLVSRTDELGSRLESGFTSFRKQSEKDRSELSSALQVMQKRFLWVSVVCGLSFAGSVGLVVSRFVLHI
jgi:hypothetical protein